MNGAELLVLPLSVAVILVDPTATVLAKPPVTMVAAEVFEECHITDAVISSVEVSEYVPTAVNCCFNPTARFALVGVIAIDCSVAAITVNVCAGLVTPLSDAVMLVVPIATAVANPLDTIVATLGVAEFHVANAVKSTVELSV